MTTQTSTCSSSAVASPGSLQRLRRPTHRVAVLTKRQVARRRHGPRGGIAAVLAGGDSFDAHVQDTLVARRRLQYDLAATRFVVENAPGHPLAARPGRRSRRKATTCT